ncbi:MAG: VanW family protein [Coriobacteriales bacterium]|nr:VanW family protein [Coriobacteriales bacterium]
MQGVDVGGLTRADAAARLEEELGATIEAAPVNLYANEHLAAAQATEGIVELDHASTSYQTDVAGEEADGEGGQAWRITAATVGASVDGAALAETAYAVGRGGDFLAGRLRATVFGVKLGAALVFEPSQLAGLENLLGEALGWAEVNADIRFEDGNFIVAESSEGQGVDHAAFVEVLSQAFLTAPPMPTGSATGVADGADAEAENAATADATSTAPSPSAASLTTSNTGQSLRLGVVPLAPIPVAISDAEAARVATLAQQAIAESVALVYRDEDPWTLDSYSLGTWIGTSIEGVGDEARLACHVAADRLAEGLRDIIGDRDPGIRPEDARFEVVDGRVTVVGGTSGTGVDYAKVASDLDDILFPSDSSSSSPSDSPARERQIVLTVTTLEPAFSTAQAKDLHITDKIASYTTEYTTASKAKVTNIHLASDLINNTLIAPGGVWSFNDTAGECNAQRGFQEATSIVLGEYVDEIGGGICQVATTVYNAVFDSGLPIVERVNHGFYLVAYPAGRDATVSWKWPDLKFENDTDSWMLLTMSYTDSSVTCTLWGTDPKYRVESESTGATDRTDFETKKIDNPEMPKGEERIKQEGVRGRTIVVTRYVYNRAGELLRKTAFKSVYAPETEVIEVGTKEEAKPVEDAEKKPPGG